MELKKCTKCGENKPNTNEYFAYSNKSKGTLIARCKACVNEYREEYYKNNKDKVIESEKKYYENNKDKIKESKKEYYENNKDKIKESRKKYRENNKDKVRERIKEYKHKKRGNGGSYTKSQWLDTLEYFDYKCAYTGECIKHSCHVEHIVPVSKGGTSYIWNLVPSTERANLSKRNRDMEEWYREQEYFCEERLNKIYEYQKYMAAKYK